MGVLVVMQVAVTAVLSFGTRVGRRCCNHSRTRKVHVVLMTRRQLISKVGELMLGASPRPPLIVSVLQSTSSGESIGMDSTHVSKVLCLLARNAPRVLPWWHSLASGTAN